MAALIRPWADYRYEEVLGQKRFVELVGLVILGIIGAIIDP